MPDRLAELVRQRALIEEHLAWLNRQIADVAQQSLASKAVSPPSAIPPSAPAALPAPSAIPLAPAAGTSSPIPAEADDILAQYQIPPAAMKEDVRKGCFLYFAAAFVALGLGVTIIYWVFKPR